MQLFYDPDLNPGTHRLREAEAKHAFQVLRKKVGDRLDLVDGRGGWFEAEVVSISKRECLIEATEVRREATRANHKLTLLVAPTKNIDRFEWILEKATEIGIDAIQPILTEHSERKRIRTDRLERVLEAAMKQSLRAWKPELGELMQLNEALREPKPEAAGFMAYLGDTQISGLKDIYRPGTDVTLVIGPEGGFSSTEANLARERGYHWANLGPQRLRTETAAITAVHTVELLNWPTL